MNFPVKAGKAFGKFLKRKNMNIHLRVLPIPVTTGTKPNGALDKNKIQ